MNNFMQKLLFVSLLTILFRRRLPGYSPTSRIPKSGLSIYNFVAGSALRCSSTTSTPQTAFASRLQEVQAAVPDPYPRLENHPGRINIADFRSRYDYLESDQVVEDTVVVQGRFRPRPGSCYFFPVLRYYVGRIRSYRLAGSKLIFFDIIQNGSKLQAMCNLRQLADITPAKFKQFYRLLRRGDSFCRSFPPKESLVIQC
jgi:lysyl-tRNA synthetase class II